MDYRLIIPDFFLHTDELGNLRLTDAVEDAIVAFLKTRLDGFSAYP